MDLTLIILLGVDAIFVLLFIVGYNGIIAREQRVRQAQSEIERELNRVAELLPNLVNVVKGAGLLEQRVLTQIADAFGRYVNAMKSSDLGERIQSSASFFGTIMPIVLQLPQFPQLQSMQQFQELFNEIRVSVDKIAYARQYLNEAVNEYNTYILSFPWVIIARLMGKRELPYFKYERAEETRRSLELGELTKGLTQW